MRSRHVSSLALVAGLTIGSLGATRFASGADPANETVFVPITPCRLVDTRPGADLNTGPRNTPIGDGEVTSFGVWDGDDANSPCEVPPTATAIATNTVAINPTARGFLTLYPADVDNPGTANLNFVAGQDPTPNAANIPLSVDGRFNVFNAFGSVNVVIDVNGYYQPSSNVGSPGPQGSQGEAGADGSDGENGAVGPRYGRTIVTRQQVSNTMNAGVGTAVTVDGFGRPIVAYIDVVRLAIVACSDAACDQATKTFITDANDDDSGRMGLTIGANGFPIVAYGTTFKGGVAEYNLEVAVCNNASCSNFTETVVDGVGIVGSTPSIAIGFDGNPVISYRDSSNGTLKVAACSDPACTAAALRTIDSSASVGRWSSLAIGTDGNPIMSYYDQDADDLKFAACGDPTCSTAQTSTLDSEGDVGLKTALAVGADGRPLITYWDKDTGTVELARCTDVTCSGADISTVGPSDDPFFGGDADITIGADGSPLIVFNNSTSGNVEIASCTSSTCEAFETTTIENDPAPGRDARITIGPGAQPLVAYIDDFAGGTPTLAGVSMTAWTPNTYES